MPSNAIDIPKNGKTRTNADNLTPSSFNVSVSASPRGERRVRTNSLVFPTVRQPKALHPVDKDEIKVLLLENISQEAVQAFREEGFQVDHFAKAWNENELVEKIGNYHAIGVRSKTKITERVIKAASKASVVVFCLLAVVLIPVTSCSSLGAFASAPTKSTCQQPHGLAFQFSTRLFPTRDPSQSWSWPRL